MNAKIEASESHAGERRHSDIRPAVRPNVRSAIGTGILLRLLRTRNQPDGKYGKHKARHSPDRLKARPPWQCPPVCRDGCAHQCRDRSREPHLSRRQGSVEDCQRESTDRARCQRPQECSCVKEMRHTAPARSRTSEQRRRHARTPSAEMRWRAASHIRQKSRPRPTEIPRDNRQDWREEIVRGRPRRTRLTRGPKCIRKQQTTSPRHGISAC